MLCANLDDLDEPEAKASLIWIIGEYAEKIENADELLGIFLESFKEEPYAVCLPPIVAKAFGLAHLPCSNHSGATTNGHGNRQALPQEAGRRAGDCTAGAPGGY